MRKKIRVAILFGGKSAEHEVSLLSARSIVNTINKDKYETILIGIDKQGKWLLSDKSRYLLNSDNPKLISLKPSDKNLAISPGDKERQPISIQGKAGLGVVDVVFPILHGTYGEDGTMQGLLKILNLPFVGAGVIGSAVGMDKDVMKRLLRDSGIPVAEFITARVKDKVSFNVISKRLGVPFFIKPANLGSSVGVSKVFNVKDFKKAADEAFRYDTKILFEEYIDGREIECSVLGNENPVASVPGEVIPHHEFYSYEAKYIDENGAGLMIPADLPGAVAAKVRSLAVKTFKVLCVEGMGRVDMFLTKKGKVYVNEINTIPGFTKISMYPKLWEATGLKYADLIDKLIQLAIERHRRDKRLKTTFS